MIFGTVVLENRLQFCVMKKLRTWAVITASLAIIQTASTQLGPSTGLTAAEDGLRQQVNALTSPQSQSASALGRAVRISLSKHQFKPHELIDVAVKAGEQPVSFCVDFVSFKDDSPTVESTPIPVSVQKHSKDGWHTLPFAPDVGNTGHSVVLEAGQTQHYPFRLSDKGEMRIVLAYWLGKSDRTCEDPPHRKTTRSKVFSVN